MNITLQQAEAVIAAAKSNQKKLELKWICVVDAGANLVAFARMDGAWMGSIDILFKKSKNMVHHGHFNAVGKTRCPLYNIEHSNGGLITFSGGVVKTMLVK
jgi:uncharacterized protein GlcG (DUF336 family)